MANVLGTLFGDIASAIREKTGETGTMKPAAFPEQIRGIETGSSADVRYVTFVSHDGSVEYGKKPVAVGDDCVDPIARGLFTTPTRESTVQYHYTFAGWATVAGGAVDSTALKAVTENRTLYAKFSAALRYYTVTYYDSDGTTVLKTESLAYGTTPTYTAAKMGYTFDGWTPALATVTGEASYQASWFEKMDFSALTWAEISSLCASEDVSKLFDIGATKTVAYTSYGGSYYTTVAEIIGFYHNDLADGSGKAPITLRLRGYPFNEPAYWHDTGLSSRDIIAWGSSQIRKTVNYTNGIYDASYGFSDAFVAVIKQVTNTYYDTATGAYATSDDYVFLPSMTELGFDISGRAEGSCYEAFTPGKTYGTAYDDLLITDLDGNVVKFWTRTKDTKSTGYVYCIDKTGVAYTYQQGGLLDTYPSAYVCIG